MFMKKYLIAAAALVALPVMAQAQTLQYPGFYAGLEGGGNYMFNTTVNTAFGNPTVYPAIGYAFGAMIGYDFVGPRVEVEGCQYLPAQMDQPPHDLGRTVHDPHGRAAQDLSHPEKVAAEGPAAGFKCQKWVLICHCVKL